MGKGNTSLSIKTEILYALGLNMILISILGDFHSSILPLIYNFKDKIDKHLLIYDDSKKDTQNAKNVNKGIKKFVKKGNYEFLTLSYKIDEDSYQSIKKCVQYILTLTSKKKDIYINTTDGYSTVTTFITNMLFPLGVNFLAYDMFDNQYNILNKKSLTTHNINNNLDIKNHFMLKGHNIETSDFKAFAVSNEKTIKKIFEKYSDEYNNFTKLDPSIYKTVADVGKEHQKIVNSILEMDKGFAYLPIKSPILTGTLFECYVYLLIKDMDYDDVEMGLKLYTKYKNSDIKNEFDILVMKENHLHMIECKFKNSVKVDELVYKYTALANIIDEDAKMAIVTKKPPKYDDNIDIDKNNGLSYKRGRLSNIYFYGAVHKNSAKFQKEIQKLFKI